MNDLGNRSVEKLPFGKNSGQAHSAKQLINDELSVCFPEERKVSNKQL